MLVGATLLRGRSVPIAVGRLTGSFYVIIVAMLLVVCMECLVSQRMSIVLVDRVYNLTGGNLAMSAKVVNHGNGGSVTVVGYVWKLSGRVEQEHRIHLGRGEQQNVIFVFGASLNDIDLGRGDSYGFELREEEPD